MRKKPTFSPLKSCSNPCFPLNSKTSYFKPWTIKSVHFTLLRLIKVVFDWIGNTVTINSVFIRHMAVELKWQSHLTFVRHMTIKPTSQSHLTSPLSSPSFHSQSSSTPSLSGALREFAALLGPIRCCCPRRHRRAHAEPHPSPRVTPPSPSACARGSAVQRHPSHSY